MGTRENIENQEVSISELRRKLWKENKIRIEGVTYDEWKREHNIK
jgi:hypothetical protein